MIKRTGKNTVAVVGWGRGMGHKGHMYLASSVITLATKMKADPYFFISMTVGKDDPLLPEEKTQIYQTVFPKYKSIFQPQGNLNTALTELGTMGYRGIIVVVGADQKEAFKYLERTNKEGTPIAQTFGLEKIQVVSRQETGDSTANLEGPRATPMREILLDPNASEEQRFAIWRDAMPEALSDQVVIDLMQKAQERLVSSNTKKKKLKEFYDRIKPLLENASVDKKAKILKKMMEFAYIEMDKTQPVSEAKLHLNDPNARINVYYISPSLHRQGKVQNLAHNIPYKFLEHFTQMLLKKFPNIKPEYITWHNVADDDAAKYGEKLSESEDYLEEK